MAAGAAASLVGGVVADFPSVSWTAEPFAGQWWVGRSELLVKGDGGAGGDGGEK